MKVRNINTISEYYDNIKISVTSATKDIEYKILSCIDKINIIFKDIDYNYLHGNKFIDLPWKIGFVQGKLYEGGLPHTRENYIILPIEYISIANETQLINLLIHEKIHVYQKQYPNDIELYLQENNFIKIGNANKQTRANPDINMTIYQKNGQNYYATYIDNPTDIQDVVYHPINKSMYEHPFEYMAYTITNNITNKLT
jgi:hypothetical protein